MHDNETSSRDLLLIAAIASGLSYQEAADAARCSKSTVARRMATSAFRAEVAEAREEHLHMLRGRLVEAQPTAVKVLSELMVGAGSEADRIRAAKVLLDVHRRDRLVDPTEVDRLIRAVVEIAFGHISEDRQDAFIAQVRALS